MDPVELAGMIDHTILRPDATFFDVQGLCNEAFKYPFASVCINPAWVTYCTKVLSALHTQVCAVVGFPLGATSTRSKVFEAEEAVENGAGEIDMVLNVGALIGGDVEAVRFEINQVRGVTPDTVLKVIIEACLLNDDQKVLACKIAQDAGADFVKTSTGFSKGGATVADVALMRKTVGPKMGVKASGGIRDYATALRMIEAGANRLGCSASVDIIEAAQRSST